MCGGVYGENHLAHCYRQIHPPLGRNVQVLQRRETRVVDGENVGRHGGGGGGMTVP